MKLNVLVSPLWERVKPLDALEKLVIGLARLTITFHGVCQRPTGLIFDKLYLVQAANPKHFDVDNELVVQWRSGEAAGLEERTTKVGSSIDTLDHVSEERGLAVPQGHCIVEYTISKTGYHNQYS